MQPGVSIDIVAQLLHSINAARPTEHALQNDNRRLNDEVVALQAQLHQQTTRADAATKTNTSVVSAYTALKRGTRIKDMIAVYHDYITPEIVLGSEEHSSKILKLTTDATATFDNTLTTGVETDSVGQEDAKLLYCNAKDKEWLLEQLQQDITTSFVEPWIW